MGRADIAIIGGGVVGSAIAFNLLALDPGLSVCVVERDPTYRTASSALSVSSIRQQFSTPVNIALSRYGMTFLKRAAEQLAVDGDAPDLGLVERGYLYLARRSGEQVLMHNHAIQRQCGVDVVLLDPLQLQESFPWLATSDLALGSFGLSNEGWFDGYSLLQAYRRKARSLGALYVTGEAVGFDIERGTLTTVLLADGGRISCGKVVNAAGPQAGDVARMANVELPVFPEKHCVFVFDCRDPPPRCPLVIDPTGVYFRPEGRLFIAGAPFREGETRRGEGLDVDHALFDDIVWPALATRVPAFETVKLTSAWAGYYEMNLFDHNAIVGTVPAVSNLYLANGFSGHGMQQAPAVGCALAELIVFGEYRTLDLRPLSYERIASRREIRELNVI